MPSSPTVHVHRNVVVRSGGNPDAPLDVWFHPAFGDSSHCYGGAFASALSQCARIFVHDPPGHGASPPLSRGSTVASCARLWRELIAHFSGSRPVVLVGHSMAGIIASRAAARLQGPPLLVIGVEANLTRADAYFTGIAAEFDDPTSFHRFLCTRIRRMARRDAIVGRFAASLELADPRTLWTLGRSVIALNEPGAAFRRLRCPKLHYWDAAGASGATRDYVARHRLPQRRLDRLGHWPMIKDPDAFYSAIADDVRAVISS